MSTAHHLLVGRFQFAKVEGLGNDFVLVDLRERKAPSLARLREEAPRVCDRRRGVGGDGLLLVCPPRSTQARAEMVVVNADGSIPEMCGNGLRCVVGYLADGAEEVVVDTGSGPLLCRREAGAFNDGVTVEVDMGIARQGAWETPAEAEGLRLLSVNIGNPHAINFVEDTGDLHELAQRLGPAIERAREYPERTNVEFARRHAGGIELVVWERGCGLTQACGTGACATVAAALFTKDIPPNTPVAVTLPGGMLTIRGETEGTQARMHMKGPARRVFEGHLEFAD